LLPICLLVAACAGPDARERAPGESLPSRSAIVRAAIDQVGAPYRWGGDSPRGFDCSGLVIYSYREVGVMGLPHSAAGLERVASRVPLSDLQPGDLLFFRLVGPKASHVAIYVGGEEFVHAPSGGKPVERVGFDHPYWGTRLGRAGRLLQ
jgi:cell wall-associated NlpC family hydrolase